MADKSSIEWTDATWNIITGCTLVDEGCRHCYAAHLITSWPAIGNHPSRKGLARKNAAGESKFTGEVRFNEQWLDQPLRWKKPRKIFVCAHGDLFHESVPDEWLDKVFAVMGLAPQHTFQVLTKRPERAREYLARHDGRRHPAMTMAALMAATGRWKTPALDLTVWPLPNVWLGTSISDQASVDLRIPQLLACPAAVRFISAEPLLGPVDLTMLPYGEVIGNAPTYQDALRGKLWMPKGTPNWPLDPRNTVGDRTYVDLCCNINWVICGGESGPHARPMHPDWARSLRDQCAAASVPFLFKQWGEWGPCEIHPSGKSPVKAVSFDGTVLQGKDAIAGGVSPVELMCQFGKKRAGRLLDGMTHDGFPKGGAA